MVVLAGVASHPFQFYYNHALNLWINQCKHRYELTCNKKQLSNILSPFHTFKIQSYGKRLYIFGMLSIRKLTEYMKKPRSATSTFKKLTSLNKIIGKGYQPLSRFQKLREAGLVYPKSTSSKLVFISNSHGNGFRNEKEYEAPSSLGVERMKQEIDQVCYDKWKEYKQFLEKDLFANAYTATKILLAVGLLTISVLFFGSMSNVEVEEMTDTIILISTVITIVCIVSAIIIFSKKSPDYDYDCLIIGAIKQKLATFNMVEKEISLNQPRFQWSCNKDCTWIAIQLFDVTS